MTTISVVIPVFNRARELPRAVESVRSQAVDAELVIVDDGSTEDIVAALTAEGLEADQLVSQTNQGVTAARNAGAEVTSGDAVVFLDSDDEGLAGWLGSYADALDAGADVVCSGAVAVGPDGAEERWLPRELGPVYSGVRGLFLAGTFAIRRPMFDAIGGYRPGLRYSEHTDLAIRLCEHGRRSGWAFATLDEPLVRVHRRDGRVDEAIRHESARTILEVHGDALAREPRLLAIYQAMVGVGAARDGDHLEARRMLRAAIRTHPAAWRNYVRLAGLHLPPVRNRRYPST